MFSDGTRSSEYSPGYRHPCDGVVEMAECKPPAHHSCVFYEQRQLKHLLHCSSLNILSCRISVNTCVITEQNRTRKGTICNFHFQRKSVQWLQCFSGIFFFTPVKLAEGNFRSAAEFETHLLCFTAATRSGPENMENKLSPLAEDVSSLELAESPWLADQLLFTASLKSQPEEEWALCVTLSYSGVFR